jgi:hypothetical protein
MYLAVGLDGKRTVTVQLQLFCGVARYVAFSTRRQSTEHSAFRQRHIIAFRPQPGASTDRKASGAEIGVFTTLQKAML